MSLALFRFRLAFFQLPRIDNLAQHKGIIFLYIHTFHTRSALQNVNDCRGKMNERRLTPAAHTHIHAYYIQILVNFKYTYIHTQRQTGRSRAYFYWKLFSSFAGSNPILRN